MSLVIEIWKTMLHYEVAQTCWAVWTIYNERTCLFTELIYLQHRCEGDTR